MSAAESRNGQSNVFDRKSRGRLEGAGDGWRAMRGKTADDEADSVYASPKD